MRFASEENLQSAGLIGDPEQPLGIGEEQAGALVGCGAARKAEGEHAWIEDQSGTCGDLSQKRFLGAVMSVEDFLFGQIDGVAEEEIVASPRRDVRIQHLLHGLGDPCGRMNTVCDGVDVELGEHGA